MLIARFKRGRYDVSGADSYPPDPSPSVLTRAQEHKQRWQEEKAKEAAQSIGYSGFLADKAYLSSMPEPNDTGRIVSKGILNPAFGEGKISRSVKQHGEAYLERAKRLPEHARAVPLGSENCFNIMPHQIGFVVRGMRKKTPKAKNGDTTIVLTTTCNGLGPEDEAIFVGITRTANSVTGGEGTDNRSAVSLAGVDTVNHQGWSTIHAFEDCIMSLTPYVIRDPNGNAKPVPAVDVSGQPEDLFVPSVHVLDERFVSIAQTKLRAKFNQNAAFKRLLEFKHADIGGPAYKTQISACVTELLKMVQTELAGFERMPRNRPHAAFTYWHGVKRLLTAIFACRGTSTLVEHKLDKLFTDPQYTAYFIKDSDKVFMEGIKGVGVLDTRGKGLIKEMAEQKLNDHEDDIMKPDGLMDFVDRQLEGVTHAWNRLIRTGYIGKSLNWANVGAEVDYLVGFGGC